MFEVDRTSFDCFLNDDGALDGIFKPTRLLVEITLALTLYC
jgi:hypothetical protein